MILADKLRKFRQQCERDTGATASDIEVPLAALLDDMCKALKVSPKQRRKVLGRKNVIRLEDTRSIRIELAKPL